MAENFGMKEQITPPMRIGLKRGVSFGGRDLKRRVSFGGRDLIRGGTTVFEIYL
jgi:hypothetical protein